MKLKKYFRAVGQAITVLLLSFVLVACAKKSNGAQGENSSQELGKVKELEKIIFSLDWTPNTNHTGLYVAQKFGYFSDAELSVEFVMPEHSVAKLVASGRADFGIRSQHVITFDIANEDIPLVSVAAILQHNTSGFSFLNSKNIQRPADFAGKTYGGWNRALEKALLPYLIEQDGGDPDSLNMVLLGDSYIAALLNDKVDFSWTYYGWNNIDFELKGLDIGYISLRDIDPVFDTYTPAIISSVQWLEANPVTTSKFIQAVAKGYEYAAQNPDKAAEILLEYAPELERELVVRSQRYFVDYYLDEKGRWGSQKREVWERFADWAYGQGMLDKPIDSSKVMTNEYLARQ